MRNYSMIFLFVAFAGTAICSPAPKPVLINPSVPSGDTAKPVAVKGMYFVADVTDGRGDDATDTLGRTRVGIHTLTSLVAVPTLTEAIKNSCTSLLTRTGAHTTDRFAARHALNLTLLEFTITETSGFLQTIQCKVRFEALIREAMSGEEVRRFTVESEDTKKAFDTTRHAESVARNALRGGLDRLMESLAKL